MAGRGKNLLIGCGVSCLVLIVLLIALTVAFGVWMRGTMKGIDESRAVRQTLEQRFGRAGEFVPWADGAVPRERMELFLRVREATTPARQALVAFFAMLPGDQAEVEKIESGSFLEKLGFALRIGRAGVGMAGNLAEFIRARNAALDEAGLGLGEYTYIYVTAYYGGLGHSPADEAEVGGHVAGAARKGGWQSSEARKDYLSQLRNLRGSLGENADPSVAAWAGRLSAEIEALENDSDRAPWQDGLPDAIRASLEPYRERLEATYSPATNRLELAQGENKGLTINVD